MEQLLLLIPVLACPIGMGLCMWLMGRHMRGREGESGAEPPSARQGNPGSQPGESATGRDTPEPALPGHAHKL